MFGLHRRSAVILGCCAAAVGLTAAPASSHTLDVAAVERLAYVDSDGDGADCSRVTDHRADCHISWIGADSGGSTLHRFELRGRRLFSAQGRAPLTEYLAEREVKVVGDEDSWEGFWLTVIYGTQQGRFSPASVAGGEGSLQMRCPNGEKRTADFVTWPAIPTRQDGVFRHTRRNGSEMYGRLSGRDVSGWLRHLEDGCSSGRVRFSGRAKSLPGFIK